MYFANSFAGATSYYGPAYVVAAVLYFAICFPLSRLALYLERRTRSRRHLATGDASEESAADQMEVTPGTHDITGRAAAATLAGGVGTMYETVDIAPARPGALAPPSAARLGRAEGGAGAFGRGGAGAAGGSAASGGARGSAGSAGPGGFGWARAAQATRWGSASRDAWRPR